MDATTDHRGPVAEPAYRVVRFAASPRMPTFDLSGLAAISINATSFMYHMPQHFISDTRPEWAEAGFVLRYPAEEARRCDPFRDRGLRVDTAAPYAVPERLTGFTWTGERGDEVHTMGLFLEFAFRKIDFFNGAVGYNAVRA